MELLPKIYNYWQRAIQQEKLFALTNYTIDEKTILIRKADLAKGCLPEPIAGLTHAVVIPLFARNHSLLFIPYMLEVVIDKLGCFTPAKHNSLPIIPRAVFELGQLNPIILRSSTSFDEFYATCPPTWLSVGYEANWDEQLAYATNFLLQQSQELWSEQLTEHGYLLDEEFSLVVPVSALCAEITLKSPLVERIYASNDNSLLSLAALAEFKFALVQAERGSGKSTYIKSLISKDWMSSVINETMPPLDVWLPYNNTQATRYANIFDCYEDHEVWLSSEVRLEIIAPQIFSDFSLSYCIQNFLSLLSEYLKKDVVHLNQASQILKARLHEYYLPYDNGCTILKSWDDLERFIHVKYQVRGGIHARIRELKQALGILQQELRYLSVILAIWQHQLALSQKLPTWFDSIVFFNYLKNRKLYKCYAQYFPDDKISLLSVKALDAKLQAKVQKLQSKEHLLFDTLHQCTNELLQLDAVKFKCKTWFRENYNYTLSSYQETYDFINIQVIKHLNFLTLKYYESVVLEDFAWSKNNGAYAKYFIDSDITTIDTLFIEHANYLPILQILPVLAKADKAVVFGNALTIKACLLPASVDLELCKFAGLLGTDVDLQALQLKGILASSTLWQFASKSLPVANTFDKSYYQKPKLEYIKVHYQSEEYMGSRCNIKELELLYELLLAWHERAESLNDVIIYTTFAGQLKQIVLFLQNTVFAHIPVKLLQAACLQRYRISIISMVYGPNDHKLDAISNAEAVLDNLLNNSVDKIVIIGDDYQLLKTRGFALESVNLAMI